MTRLVSLLAAGTLALVGAGCSAEEFTTAGEPMGKCSTYGSQIDAQVAWENAGRPKAKDPDKDGQVCESLPSGNASTGKGKGGATDGARAAADPENCKTTDEVVEIGLSSTKHADVLAHARRAGEKGFGKVLSDSPYPVWTINRAGADERRDALLADIPTKPGMDRDEAPPAFARSQVDASVEYVESSQNRSAGATMGIKARQWCSGVKFRYVAY